MILDAIVELFAEVFGALFHGVFAVVEAAVNLIAAGLELLIALVVPGFKMKRMARSERRVSASSGEPAERHGRSAGAVAGAWLLVILVAVGVAFFPKMMKRSITLVATDGHSLPRAAVIIHAKDGDQHLRSDSAGNFEVPRFGLKGITIKDPRYVEQTWSGDAITRQLVVRRTVLGAGLDRLAGKLLQPAAD